MVASGNFHMILPKGNFEVNDPNAPFLSKKVFGSSFAKGSSVMPKGKTLGSVGAVYTPKLQSLCEPNRGTGHLGGGSP